MHSTVCLWTESPLKWLKLFGRHSRHSSQLFIHRNIYWRRTARQECYRWPSATPSSNGLNTDWIQPNIRTKRTKSSRSVAREAVSLGLFDCLFNSFVQSVNMMSAGIYFGLFGHMWYSFLDKRFPGKHKLAVTKKLMAEVAMGPPLVSGVFLLISRLKGIDFDKSFSDLKSNFALICAVSSPLIRQ